MSARSLVTSAKLLALCTLVSRVTGLVRDILLARAFGVGWVQDAFSNAFQIPNLFRRLFGEGALTAAFVPTFTRVLAREGRPAAWALCARALALIATALIAITAVGEIVIGLLWTALPPGHPYVLPLLLAAVMLPFMISICLLALLSSVLNCLDRYVAPALASVVLNVVMIAGILWAAPLAGPSAAERAFGVAWSVVAAGLLQLVFIYPSLRAAGVQLGWRFDLGDPGVREMMAKVVPVLFGQGIVLISTFVDSIICLVLTHVAGKPDLLAESRALGIRLSYPLEEGALSAITFAQRLYQFPLGVLVISLATVALPSFSRLAAREDWTGWAGQVRAMLRLAVFEGLMAGAMMIVLAEPITRLLFEYGEFDAEGTRRAAHVLVFYGLGLWAFCAQHIVVRGFYSVHDVRTPVVISCILLPVNLALTLTLVWVPGVREAAFAISTSVTATLGVVLGLVLLSRRARQPLFDADTAAALGRMLLGALIAALLVGWLRGMSPSASDWVSGAIISRAIDALGWLGVGVAVYLTLGRLMRLKEVGELVRWKGARSAAD